MEGRLDTVIEEKSIGDQLIIDLDLQRIYSQAPEFLRFSGYTYLHKKHPEIVPALEVSLKSMKKTELLRFLTNKQIRLLYETKH